MLPGVVDIELRHLRAFVAVAEELNFTRAAKRLFIAQQALSAQIQQLEARIGAQLLERNTRSVSLTPAGEALCGQARLLLSSAEAAVSAARQASASATTTLTVGFVAAVVHADVSVALDRFGEVRPDVELFVRFGNLLEPSGGLRDREVDAAFVYGPFDRRDLVLTPLYADRMGVAMSAGHPLASKTDLTIADVVAEPTFDFPTPDAEWRAFWSADAFRNGEPPRYVAQFRTLEGLVTALRGGLGVHLAAEGLKAIGDDLAWRHLPELPPLEHSIARRADDDRPVVAELVEVVAEAMADRG